MRFMRGRDVDEYGVRYSTEEKECIKKASKKEGFYIHDGKLFRYEGENEEITLPDSVVTIYRAAFIGKTFKSLKLNEGLKTIEKNAFVDCKIDKLILSESVAEIKDHAFALSKIKIFESNSPNFVIENNGLYELMTYMKRPIKRLIRYIGDEWVPHEIETEEWWDTAAFLDVKMPEHFIVPKNVLLNYWTFVGNIGIKEVEFPPTYLEIDTEKLSSFGSVDKIILQEGITSVGDLPRYSNEPWIYRLRKPREDSTEKNRQVYYGQEVFRFGGKEIVIPDSVKHIANVHGDCTIICHQDSFAYNYAKKHGIKIKLIKNK